MTTAAKLSPVKLNNVCVVIPVFRDAEPLHHLLNDLKCGAFQEIIVSYADDSECELANRENVKHINSPRSRGRQIAEGISCTDAEWIWVLHADVRVSRVAMLALHDALNQTNWGAFKVSLVGRSKLLSIIGFMMNLRSRWTSIYTGDQGMYVRSTLLDRIGGYPTIPLMEDVECSRLLRQHYRGSQLSVPLSVSARKWDSEGAIRTILNMWLCRILFFFGTSPETLADRYYR
ncbi:MAG: glycosyltransferase family 2 protein [Gammaproteobacteria bacterium]|nr:glycosyltransferase family 2 protein [Gammaproteobacteria bacterium]